MSTANPAQPTIVQPGAGQVLNLGPAGIATVLLGGEQSGEALTGILTRVAPGGIAYFP